MSDETMHEPQMGLTFEKVWAMFQESRREFEQSLKESRREFEQGLKESRQEFKQWLQESAREFDRRNQETNQLIGNLSRKFGSMVEHLILPNIKEKFKALGYAFERSSPNVIIEDFENKIFTEIDIFLENGDYAMAVEVKAQPSTDNIRDHIERLEKLRRYENLHHRERKLYGAIAGAIFHEEVRQYALKQGLYAIEQSGDTVEIFAPGNLKTW